MEEKEITENDMIHESQSDETTSTDGGSVDELTLLKNQLEEQKDKFLRLFAEFDNYKKRVAKEKLELFSTAGKDIIVDFLAVLDDFERANKANEQSEDLSAIKDGIALIFDKMKKTMDKKGVKEIEAINCAFDPEKHEAITEIPSPNEDMKGKVIDVMEKGYMMNDKIIRYAKVVVGK
jgi:molecular chaperone GrpE